MSTPSSQPTQVVFAPQFPSIPRVQLWDDYGPVGEGASLAHYVRGENGNEYIVKGPTLNPGLPWVASNELIAAELGAMLSLPVLDYRIVEQGQDLFFGSSWLDKNRAFYPALTRDLFAKAANRGRAYDIVAFDYWIYNTDRHQQNLLLRKAPNGGAELLTLNDHSHSLVQAGTSPQDMVNYVGNAPFLHLDFLREYISDPAHLGAAIALIEGLQDATIRAVVYAVPDMLLGRNEKVCVESFLIARRDNLRTMISGNRVTFPNLGGGSI